MDNNPTSEGWTYPQQSWTLEQIPLWPDIDNIWPTPDASMEVDETNLIQQQIECPLSYQTNLLAIEHDPTLYGLQNDSLSDSILYNDPFLSAELYYEQPYISNTKPTESKQYPLSTHEPVRNSPISVQTNSEQPPAEITMTAQNNENKKITNNQGPKCENPTTQPINEELSSLATSNNPNIFHFGDLMCTISENDHVRLSLGTGYHITREQGCLNIKVSTKKLDRHPNGCFIRATLVRKNPDQRQKIINHICRKHNNTTDNHLKQHVIQSTLDPSLSWYENSTQQKSVNFWLQENPNAETLEAIVSLKFMCATTCEVTKDSLSCHERGREWILILTAECINTQRVFARRILDVWPKATINARDLYKPERLQPKGVRSRIKARNNQAKSKAIHHRICHLVDIAKKYKIPKDEIISVINNQWEKINTLSVQRIY